MAAGPEDQAVCAAGGQLGLLGLDLAEHQKLHGLVAKLGVAARARARAATASRINSRP